MGTVTLLPLQVGLRVALLQLQGAEGTEGTDIEVVPPKAVTDLRQGRSEEAKAETVPHLRPPELLPQCLCIRALPKAFLPVPLPKGSSRTSPQHSISSPSSWMISLLPGNLHPSASDTQISIISSDLFPKLQILNCQVPDSCPPLGDLQPPLT